MYWPGRRFRQTERGVPVRDSCRAPNREPRPVRQGKKSGPAEGLQGISVPGRVGQWQDGPVQEVLAVGLLTALPGLYGTGEGWANRRTGRYRRPGQYGKERMTGRYGRDSCAMHIHHNS